MRTRILVMVLLLLSAWARVSPGEWKMRVHHGGQVDEYTLSAVDSLTFHDVPLSPPTVTNVAVLATSPNNGTVPYNTGTVTLRLTGTGFASVVCAGGVKLDNLDGSGLLVGTAATSCSVDADTQITATFPSGIRTNGATGWNVQVTNAAGTNPTSAVRFVPRAGLLVSEVFTGVAGAATREFLEVYNPTSTTIDPAAVGLRLHIIGSGGIDVNKTLALFSGGLIPSHGFLLIVSSESIAGDAWYPNRDMTYSATSNGLVASGGAYLSLSSNAGALVIDKAGWGLQPPPGFEGTAMANIPSGQSSERKPANGLGHATDTDNNSSDFNSPSGSITPRGTVDPPQPAPMTSLTKSTARQR